MKSLLTVTVCAALLGATAVSSADTPAQLAAQHSAKGAQAMAAGNAQLALEHYVVAHAYEPNANRLYDVARAFEGLKRAAAAVALYQRVLQLAAHGPAADAARARIAALGSASPPTTTGGPGPTAGGSASVTLTIMPPGAEVWVDGQLKGRAPLPAFTLPTGAHKLEVKLAGYRSHVETLQLAANQPVNKMVTLQPGSGTASPPPRKTTTTGTGAPPLASASDLSGTWQGRQFDPKVDRATKFEALLKLKTAGGGISGTLVVKGQRPIERWRQKQCGGATTATWLASYSVRLVGKGDGRRLAGSSVSVSDCTCKGACRPESSIDWPVVVAPTGLVMAGEVVVFQRSETKVNMRAKVSPSDLNGVWQLLLGGGSSRDKGLLKLTASGQVAKGLFGVGTKTPIARWRRKQCNGDAELTATHMFEVTATPSGEGVEFSFDHQKTADCSCKAACAAARKSIDTSTVWMTNDGRHLVGRGILLTRR